MLIRHMGVINDTHLEEHPNDMGQFTHREAQDADLIMLHERDTGDYYIKKNRYTGELGWVDCHVAQRFMQLYVDGVVPTEPEVPEVPDRFQEAVRRIELESPVPSEAVGSLRSLNQYFATPYDTNIGEIDRSEVTRARGGATESIRPEVTDRFLAFQEAVGRSEHRSATSSLAQTATLASAATMETLSTEGFFGDMAAPYRISNVDS